MPMCRGDCRASFCRVATASRKRCNMRSAIYSNWCIEYKRFYWIGIIEFRGKFSADGIEHCAARTGVYAIDARIAGHEYESIILVPTASIVKATRGINDEGRSGRTSCGDYTAPWDSTIYIIIRVAALGIANLGVHFQRFLSWNEV